MKKSQPTIEQIKVDDLIPYATNSRTHSAEQVAQIAASMVEFGWTNPVLIDTRGTIVAGHGRVMAARKLGMDTIPCIRLGHLTPAQVRAYVIADNKLALNAGWDDAMLKAELDILKEEGFNMELTGFSEQEIEALLASSGSDGPSASETNSNGSLSEKFGIPPFSVLNAREGWWQERKRQWIALGIQSEVGRAGNLLGMSETMLEPDEKLREMKALMRDHGTQTANIEMLPGYYTKKNQGMTDEQIVEEYLASGAKAGGTSIFDPVLAELAYRWFSPENGVILDPFAGGSVRGIVATKTNRQYIGCDLRQEQVEANREQASTITPDNPPIWHCTDSRNIDRVCKGVQADMIFSCPPYADLEVYSDDPKDLSTLPYNDFVDSYREIIAKACSLLKPDSFACFVVGDVRDKKGNYYNFVGDTIQAFIDAGLSYYNEAILVTPVGTLPIRAGRTFAATRKLGKTHQNVLVFVKGDGKRAANRCGIVDVTEAISAANSGEELPPGLPE